jgi:hypothetical protein
MVPDVFPAGRRARRLAFFLAHFENIFKISEMFRNGKKGYMFELLQSQE